MTDERSSPDLPDPGLRGPVSRRAFMQGVGVSAAATAIGQAATADLAGSDTTADEMPIVGPDPVRITLQVNGQARALTVDPATTLLDALRFDLELTGSKEICDRGACGGCSVLLDGDLVCSCMTLALDAEGRAVTTVEGLANGDQLDPVQEAFVRHDAVQCGYCTPGLVVAARALLNDNPTPTLSEIKHGLSGNMCRCGTYSNVFNAVLDASGQAPVRDSGGDA